jgi:hypothetical protein
MKLTDTDAAQENAIEPGTQFWETYKGLTMSGFGKVSKCWEVVEHVGEDWFICKLIDDNTVLAVNRNFTQQIHINAIRASLRW